MDREDKQKQLIMDFLNTFTSEGGKRVLEGLSAFCYENKTTFCQESTHDSAFAEGARSVILYIREMLAKKPDEKKQEVARS